MTELDWATGGRLLRRARAAIQRHICGHSEILDSNPWPDMPDAGVFVTLRKFERLRGCIGTFEPRGGLLDSVDAMAVAATEDPRFRSTPISSAELKDLTIELSILSPRRRIDDLMEFEFGRHGVYIRNGYAAGCFLPDVGQDNGWNREQFLSELCRQKAGLSPDAWRDPRTEIYVFTVQKFRD